MAIMKDGPFSVNTRSSRFDVNPYDPYWDILIEQKPTLPDGRRITYDGLVHIFKNGYSLCEGPTKRATLIRIANQLGRSIDHSEPTEDHVNCPVCVISSRKMIEDLINPPEKKPEDKFGTRMSISTAAAITALGNRGVSPQNSIVNIGIPNQSMLTQANTQFEAQQKLLDTTFWSSLANKLKGK